MSIQERRTAKGWSQEELALHTGLSVRTIQRIEAGRKAGLESLKCLAAVFETTVSELMQEQNMTTTTQNISNTPSRPTANDHAALNAENHAIAYVQNVKAFHMHWISFAIIVPGLYFLNTLVSPDVMWVWWVAPIWACALALNAIVVFGLFHIFSPDWEQREFKKRMAQDQR